MDCGFPECQRKDDVMKKVILYIHGKGGNAEESEHYKDVCRGYDVTGFDYKGSTPWETREELLTAYEGLFKKYGAVTLIANSIGAYFAMNALEGKPIEQAFFISPIVDMERLISDMMKWAEVTETELKEKLEIKTAFNETLSWNYLRYVREHPINWTIPTDILYAGGDHLTPLTAVSAFAEKTGAKLTIMEHGEHWFHTPEQMMFLDNWLKERLKRI